MSPAAGPTIVATRYDELPAHGSGPQIRPRAVGREDVATAELPRALHPRWSPLRRLIAMAFRLHFAATRTASTSPMELVT